MSNSEEEEEFGFSLLKYCRENYLNAINTNNANVSRALQAERRKQKTKELLADCDIVDINDCSKDETPLSDRLKRKVSKKHNSEASSSTRVTRNKGRQRKVKRTNKFNDSSTVRDKKVIEHITISDSDDDKNKTMEYSDIEIPEIDETPSNDEILIKVRWRLGRIHKFPIRRFQKMAALFTKVAEMREAEENSNKGHVILLRNDDIIYTDDTPDSLDLTIGDILEGGIIDTPAVCRPSMEKKQKQKNELEFKLLMANRKKPLLITIDKKFKMELVKIKCSETLEIPLEKLKFSFDGEELDGSLTPKDLDLEGGECIDVCTKL